MWSFMAVAAELKNERLLPLRPAVGSDSVGNGGNKWQTSSQFGSAWAFSRSQFGRSLYSDRLSVLVSPATMILLTSKLLIPNKIMLKTSRPLEMTKCEMLVPISSQEPESLKRKKNRKVIKSVVEMVKKNRA